MKIRLTDNKNNIYTIYDNKEIAIGKVSQDFTSRDWVATSQDGTIIALGHFSHIVHVITA